jgi:predicted RNA binding protein YcfA (HicA-like mRNA interferase family)
MAYSANVWNQLKNTTADELIGALVKDGWELEPGCIGAIQVYRNPKSGDRVSVHWHPKKTYGPKLLKGLLDDIGWSETDMKKLKLIK